MTSTEMNIPNLNLPIVVIIGAGFAGLRLAKTIDSKLYQVVLIDKNNYHTFQPLMYQVASSGLEPDSIVYPVRKVFKGKANFHFRMAEVKTVEVKSQKVHTSIGCIDYDFLVIATGAMTNFFGNKEIPKYAYTMKSLVESLDLRSAILQNFEKALGATDLKEREAYMNFVIVGAGATGIELAGALAELKNNVLPNDYPDLDFRLMQIHIIEASGKVLPAMSEKASAKSLTFIKELGVNIWLNTMVKDYDGGTVITNKKNFDTKTLVWTAGVKGAPVDAEKWTLNKNDRIVVDCYNKMPDYENIYAIGDNASMESKKNHRGHAMLASVAGQQGAHLGENFNRVSKNKTLKPFKYVDRGTMATIGRNKAVVDLKHLKFSGPLAWMVWMFLHLMLLVDYRNRIIVFANWCWSYVKFDQGLRLIIRPSLKHGKRRKTNTGSDTTLSILKSSTDEEARKKLSDKPKSVLNVA